jgi:hypothetical protein
MRILMCGTGGAGKKNFEQTVRNLVDWSSMRAP